MYRARDRVDNEEWLAEIDRASDRLDLGSDARSNAADLFLSDVPPADRSKRAAAAASLYAGALIAGEERSQTAVAEAMGVTRLSVQSRWKEILERAGFRPPGW
ncbi:transcription initiation factor IIB family protein [Halegenticoccus tardaugens]|uniref:transcription initiation factor IIB family protein n=1 Tax=Halegenticoccus tardaugens TaxID=2071624 RepID=UPI00100C30F8|nr:transcription initiation factor IIB family protein [Halegenticoccus tardaugens]